MWEVLNDDSLVALEVTFHCVCEDHHRLLPNEINWLAQAKRFFDRIVEGKALNKERKP